MSNPQIPLQTVYSTFVYRRPLEAERKEHLWSTLWVTPELDGGPFDSEAEAQDWALAEWEKSRFGTPYLVRFTEEEGFLGPAVRGWHVYTLALVENDELGDVASGALEVFVRELDESPFRDWDQAVWTAKRNWVRKGGRFGMVLRSEVLDRREITRRRLARSEGRTGAALTQ